MQRNEQRQIYVKAVQDRLSEKRFIHSLGVEKAAVALARRYGECEERASTAALLHDYAKELPKIRIIDFSKAISNYNR